MRRVAILMVLILTGCDSNTQQGSQTVGTPTAEAVKPSLFSDYRSPSECEKAGGTWKAWCVPNTASCAMPWPDGGKQCSDSSECESRMCMVDLEVNCEPGEECIDPPVLPKTGDRAMGICKREDLSCGSYIEIKGGIAQEPYSID
jgi:hypothetical protein